ncbi:hypothetical protein [Vibrio aestuarianus]|uniref:hypothetical protein n=1 Tax=Vibrio aestuarianus TaxID=28171 RepID=UPI003BB5DCA6
MISDEIRIMLRTMKITLTPQQKQQLEEMHDSTRDGRVRDRIKGIRPMIPRGDIVSVGSSKAGVHRYQAQISLALSCT